MRFRFRILLLPVLLALLPFSEAAAQRYEPFYVWNRADEPARDRDGNLLPGTNPVNPDWSGQTGALVHIIAVGNDGAISPPGNESGNWGMPTGDDQLIRETRVGTGVPWEWQTATGRFCLLYGPPPAENIYARAFNAPDLAGATHYGDSQIWESGADFTVNLITDRQIDPSPTPEPSPTASPTPSASPTTTPTPVDYIPPTPSPTASPTPSATPSAVPSPTASPSATPAPSATPFGYKTPSPTPSATASPTPSATPSPSPSPVPLFSRWYLPAGATAVDGIPFDTYILINNLEEDEAPVRVIFAGPDGKINSFRHTIPARARYTVKVNNHVSGDLDSVSTIILSEKEQRITAERAVYWSSGGISWIGGHNTIGIDELSDTWYLAEGATHRSFDLFVHVLNPDQQEEAEVTASFVGQFGTWTEITRTLGPESNWTIRAKEKVGEKADVSTIVTSDRPVAVDRTMYWDGNGIDWVGGHSSRGVSVPTDEWFLAEGATHIFDEYILVLNPSTDKADIFFLFIDPDGDTEQHREELGPGRRLTVKVNDHAPGRAGISTIVRSLNGVGVIAERAMYYDTVAGGGINWGAGHNTIGLTGPAYRWYLPEGATHEFDQYILVINTSEDPNEWATVEFTFTFQDGSFTTFTDLVGPQFRHTVNVGRKVGRRDQVSTRVESTNEVPIVVERAMYWPRGGPSVWHGAHGTIGIPAPIPVGTPTP